MAEFQEVIEQFKRLCDSANQDCLNCGLGNMSCSMKDIVDNSVEFEKRVMSWAAEHPSPVYPTWVEYLVGIGVIPHEIRLETVDALMDTHLLKPIPADIAEKLGIKPKEG